MDTHFHRRLTEIFLTALEIPASERSTYLTAACQDNSLLRNKVEKMLLAHERSNVALDQPIFEIAAKEINVALIEPSLFTLVGKNIGRYRIIKEIGQGGMGIVCLAMRIELPNARPVALKILRYGMDTETMRNRFQRECEILSSLEHTNIARLLDNGIAENNLPFFVMEMVEGEPIDAYCKTHNLTITERLKLFQQVCAAVNYAHQNLIIHRDLKPNNILVSKDGVPKLLDFGIAKTIRKDAFIRDIEITRTGQQIMTPAYASPEQVRGEYATTAVDIYSLGILLYKMLTGQLPYEFANVSPEEIKRVICEVAPNKPLITFMIDDRKLSKDIENILLMALRKEPQRRYSSVEKLSEDIRRYLEGFPVIACKDALSYRVQKFLHRNMTKILIVVVISLSTAIAASIILRQSWRAQQEHLNAEIKQKLLEARTKDLRQLAGLFVFKLNDQIEDLPGTTATRANLLKETLKYLEILHEQSGDDLSLQNELAIAYRKVGDVQGRPYIFSSIGDTAGALKSYRRAMELLEGVVIARPNNNAAILELVTVDERIGEVLARMGLFNDAMNSYRKALIIRERLLNLDPENIEYRRLLASLYIRIGDIKRSSGDLVNAFNIYEKASAISEELILKDATNNQSERALATAYMRLSLTLEALGDIAHLKLNDSFCANIYYRKSLAFGKKTIDLIKKALIDNSNSALFKSELAGCELKLAGLLLKNGKILAANRIIKKTIVTFKENIQQDPRNAEYQRRLALAYEKASEIRLVLKDFHMALNYAQYSLSINEQQYKLDPTNHLLQQELAYNYELVSMVYTNTGQIDKALANGTNAFEIRKKLLNIQPGNAELHNDFLESSRKLSLLLLKNGKKDEAIEVKQASFKLLNDLIKNREIASLAMNSMAWLLLTGYFIKDDETKLALNYAKQADLNLQSKDLISAIILFQSYLHNNDAKNAINTLQRWISFLPAIDESEKNSIFIRNRGRTIKSVGNY